MAKKGALDQKFSIKQAVEAAKSPLRSPLADEKFSINDVKETAKDLFGKGVCVTCGCGLRKPIRSVVHYYDEHSDQTLGDVAKKVAKKAKQQMPVAVREMPETGDLISTGSGMRRKVVKGSPEAIAWGKKMREARMKKM